MTKARDATLRDVAGRVGVSTRTVSRVVNDEGGFSESTRSRVLAAIDELGYRPNLLARGLITRRSGTIGLVVSDMTDPFFPEVAEGVQRAAREVGLTMFFAGTGGDPVRQREVLTTLQSHAVDGVLIFPIPGTAGELPAVAASGLPLVVIDEEIVGNNLVSVTSDIRGGAELAVGLLREDGRRRIAMAAGDVSTRRWREQGYRKALAGTGQTPLIERDEPDWRGGATCVERLLAADPAIDAVFAYNDLMALGALRALAEAGRRVPDDVAVVGFDNIDVSAAVTPSLTTVNLDRERLGREAVAHLQQVRDEPTLERLPTVLPVDVVRRESS